MNLFIKLPKRKHIIPILVVSVPFAVFIVHSYLFRDWIIDDAGISYAYARNLANGFGLVSQPGVGPIEGYSNFLWVAMLAPIFLLRAFHPVLAPKILSIVLIGLLFLTCYKVVLSISKGNRLVAFSCLFLISVNSSFVIWTNSGLENALYTLIICLIVYFSLRVTLGGSEGLIYLVVLGMLAGLAAITRPEGVLFFFIFPFVLSVDLLAVKGQEMRTFMTKLLVYALPSVLLLGAFLLFRRVYFQDWFPNTFYAKWGEESFAGPELSSSIRTLIDIVTLQPRIVAMLKDLMSSIAGPLSILVSLLLLVVSVYLISNKRFSRSLFVILVFTLGATFLYLFLPEDWMGEFRFATPFFTLFYIYATATVYTFIKSFNLAKHSGAILFALLAFVCVVGSMLLFKDRSMEFAERPTVPLEWVTDEFARRYDGYAEQLGVEGGSILLPDIGGCLYYSELRVYDLGGLCDRTIAKTIRQDREAFLEYVFGTMKPTFIHTHDSWTVLASLDHDSRFRQEYVVIYECGDSATKEHRGDYVRRDVVAGKEAILEEMRQNYWRTCDGLGSELDTPRSTAYIDGAWQ